MDGGRRAEICLPGVEGLHSVGSYERVYTKVRLSLIGFCIRWFMQGVILGSIALLLLGWDFSSGGRGWEEPRCQKKERPDTLILLGALGMNCMYVCRRGFSRRRVCGRMSMWATEVKASFGVLSE